jgi:hypothetical protein
MYKETILLTTAILTIAVMTTMLAGQAFALGITSPQELKKELAGKEAQVLAGHDKQLVKAGLGDVCLSCWGG